MRAALCQLKETPLSLFSGRLSALEYDFREWKASRGFCYETLARDSISLAQFPTAGRILDIGCGTGVSSGAILHELPHASVIALDASPDMLQVTRSKISPAEQLNPQLREAFINFGGQKKDGNLRAEYLAQVPMSKLSGAQGSVQLYEGDAISFQRAHGKEIIDGALANQVIHWLRHRDAPNGDNFQYESDTLKAIWRLLKPRAAFVFNTSGADYEFQQKEINDRHIVRHPFYLGFLGAVSEDLSKRGIANLDLAKMLKFTFPKGSLEKALTAAGFSLNPQEVRVSLEVYGADTILANCEQAQANMHVFIKNGLGHLDEDLRKEILDSALSKMLKNRNLRDTLTNTVAWEAEIHIVARKQV